MSWQCEVDDEPCNTADARSPRTNNQVGRLVARVGLKAGGEMSRFRDTGANSKILFVPPGQNAQRCRLVWQVAGWAMSRL